MTPLRIESVLVALASLLACVALGGLALAHRR
jgi:hypothetical protein